MIDFAKKIEERITQILETKREFNVLYVTDDTSRLACVRGYNAMQQFRQFYSSIAEVTLTSMDSKTFCRTKPDLSLYSVVWVDNVISRAFNDLMMERMREAFNKVAPGWRDEADQLKSNPEAYDKFMKDANEYRSLTLRVVYSLDEFVWDAPASRNRTIVEAKMVADCLDYADTIVVPNNELRTALVQLQLVAEDKDVVIIPSFVSSYFYPTHKVFLKSKSGFTTIRKPKILVKGTDIPQNVQNLIIHGTDEYDFTISTVSELDPRLMELLRPRSKKEGPLVRHVMHWANPYVTAKNTTETMAMERDAGFDFVLLTEPKHVDEDIYNITIADTDAILSIAAGSVVFAQIAEAGFEPGVHICNECGKEFVFGQDTTVKELMAMLEKWRITVNWDEAYTKQRTLMEHRLVSDPKVLAGYFHSMLGRRVSTALKTKFDEGMAKLKKQEAEQAEQSGQASPEGQE